MHASADDGQISETISSAVSRLYLDKFGKGPMSTETYVNGDVVTTLMRDVYTTAERSMADAGKGDSVLATRMEWQLATEPTFKASVSRAAGRPVLSVISGFELADDLAVEVFVLAPA